VSFDRGVIACWLKGRAGGPREHTPHLVGLRGREGRDANDTPEPG